MSLFALATVGILTLLLVASAAFLVSERVRFPFTILLFLVGFGLYLLTAAFPALGAIFQIQLSPDMIFYIFLPTLLFESSYKMSYRRLVKDAVPILALAVGSMLVSAVLVAGLGYLAFQQIFGWEVPFIVLLLFGAIISATDPVAVLAIFKDFGVPKRLEMLFDGESVFNDGTALALFLIVFEVARSGVFSAESMGVGVLTFLSMMILGVAYGATTGTLVSKLIGRVGGNHAIEITLMMALAHLTFISAELISHAVSEHGGAFAFLRISPVVATAIAAVTLGNYGRYKISPPVFRAMDLYWGYFAFVCNSLIFLMMGYLIGTLEVAWSALALPIAAMIVIVAAARALSIYSVVVPLNVFLRHKIPLVWQHLLAYGSLRGGLAIAMILMLPADLTIAGWNLPLTPVEFLKAITLGCIIFTLVVKATTFGAFMRRLGVGEYSAEESFTDCELRSFIYNKISTELETLKKEHFLLGANCDRVAAEHRELATNSKARLGAIMQTADFQAHVVDIVARYALGIERYAAEQLFAKGEITERVMSHIHNQIEEQYVRIELGEAQVKPTGSQIAVIRRITDWLDHKLTNDHERLRDKYLYNLAREKMCMVVQHDLAELQRDLGEDAHLQQAFSEVQLRYADWHARAVLARQTLTKEHTKEIEKIDCELARAIVRTTAVHTIEHLHEHEIVPEKVHGELMKSWH